MEIHKVTELLHQCRTGKVFSDGILYSIWRQAIRLLKLTSLSLSGAGKSQQLAIIQKVNHPDTNHVA